MLQGFNSVLTMLDGRGGSEGGYEGGADFGSPGPSAGRERRPAMASSRRDDMDDEIPF